MKLVVVTGIDATTVASAVGMQTYTRGAEYMSRRAVQRMEWDDADRVLRAVVRGSGGAQYETVVHFQPLPNGTLNFAFGACSCPVGFNCKHAVAVALTASGAAGRATGESEAGVLAGRVLAGGARQPAPPSWEQGLSALLGPVPPGSQAIDDALPLALELTLTPPQSLALSGHPAGALASRVAPGAPKLLARLVRPGRSGWVASNLSWSRIDSPYYFGDYQASHVRLLRELYALHRSHANGSPGYYTVREDRSIDLAPVGGRRLWSWLDEAAETGLALVHARKRLGSLDGYGQARLCLDVSAGSSPGALAIAPVLRVEGTEEPAEDAKPVLFLGAEGDGVVHVSRAQLQREPNPADWRLRLAKLAEPVPPPLRRMALEDQRLAVPAGQQARFSAEFYPRLRQMAQVVCADGSFTPPAIPEPTLVLRAAYGEDHELALDWEWAYDIGEQRLRAPVVPGGATEGFRDPAREKAVLDALEGRLGPRGEELAPSTLRGLDTLRFTTEVLPLLSDAPGVSVEVSGEPASYREAGDALRIGVSTSELAGEGDWFDLGVDITVEGREVPFAPLFAALASGESHLLLPDGVYFSLEKPQLRALRTLIEEARALRDAPSGPLRISRFQAGLWEELAALGVVERQARAWQQQVAGLLAPGGLAGPELPAALCAQLRPYQREGFDWLCFLWRHRLGGILADDMGLGKTLQTLALICHAQQAGPGMDPFLVIAPTSVVANWASEAARFAPGLTVRTITDTLRRRGQDLPEAIVGADVVVTSYTLLRLDADAYASARWSGLILDEAQFTKNHQSKVYQCARRLPAPFKLAITGTPMENNIMELWSLLSITAPGLFPNPERFKEMYARPIEKNGDAELLARLRRRIKPLVKRRTKEQVAADLPAKQEQLLEVELDPRHRRIYQRHLQRERQKVLGLIDDIDRNRFTILRSITLLRQLSLHPGLVEPEHQHLGSSKIDALVEQLTDVVAGGHRALVFSQFTGFLAHVRERLEAAGLDYSYLDGSTRRRAEVVRQFKEGTAGVFLISLKAGGFGLNLTEADYCFLLDPWWNPATEAQAIDRTHRIGQTRNVMVYRLIAKDTIEEKVLALARKKAELFSGVMNDGNAFGAALSAEDIRGLIA